MIEGAHVVTPKSQADPVLAQAPCWIGKVTLVARDLDRLSAFYEEVIGLTAERGDGFAHLGVNGTVLLELRHDPTARMASPREAGLFHTAFLLPTRADLGSWLQHVADRQVSITGASDHLVSEAIYLTDPEGNGIEVYADRPSASWSWRDGSVAMSTERLDLRNLIAAATAPWAGMPVRGTVGHVHLQSGDLSRAAAFYADILGFEITARYSGALFYGSGGYHHQLATNVWNSRGAGRRTGGETGLDEIELVWRDPSLLEAVQRRLEGASEILEPSDFGLLAYDPWGTRIRLVQAG